jgi:hypothetical protein
MAREERRLEPALAPASGPVPVDMMGERLAEPKAVAATERDGAHRTLSAGQAVFLALAGLSAAAGIALDPSMAMTIVHHLFFAIFLLGGATRLAAACTPLPLASSPSLADEDLPTYTIIAPLYREAEVVAELVENLSASTIRATACRR